MKNRKGLSILEVAFSVAIIGLVIIFVIGMYSTFFTSGTKLNDENIANFLAKSYLNRYMVYANSEDESLRNIVRNLANQSTNQVYQAQFGVKEAQFVGRRNFNIEVTGRLLYSGDVSDTILVSVTVSWIAQTRGLKQGYGRTSLTLEKAVNVPK